MSDSSKELVELDCELLNETPKAYRVRLLCGKKYRDIWAGKTVSEVIANSKGTKLMIQRWLAEKEGLL